MFIVTKHNNFNNPKIIPNLYDHNNFSISQKLMHIFHFYFDMDNNLSETLVSLMEFDSSYIELFSGISLHELNTLSYYNLTQDDKGVIKIYSNRIANNFKNYLDNRKLVSFNYEEMLSMLERRQSTIDFNITIKTSDIDIFKSIDKDIKSRIYSVLPLGEHYLIKLPSYYYHDLKINSISYEYKII